MTSRLAPVLDELRRAAPDLQRRGIVHAGVFGSVARGDERPDSDIDIVIEYDVERIGDILDLVTVADAIGGMVRRRLPGSRVDVADACMLRPPVRAAVQRDAVYAF
ncbi:nucleotidyltransferase family protein [Caenispirillum bisanense]|uniref:Polymerase nucleotidyl transferase domain-containing protein n=1 Tax=Caenispirillum bisanense TaxID=414052 RepID=A0A286GUM8_9PROT|nr:nucleotidyltransferase domain-containing protein [Caenispirillum bisanense]SOD98876.1 hypothetical protein SAMN05421508_108119 [Caenispirillum bisanense]